MKFGKTDVRYWRGRVTHRLRGRVSPDFYVRIQHAGVIEWFNLATANRDVAAQKAKEIYLSLVSEGWDATKLKFKAKAAASPASLSLGEYLDLVRTYSGLTEICLMGYSVRIRTVVGTLIGHPGCGDGKWHTGKHSSREWRRLIEATPLDLLTPERLHRWATGFVSARGTDPISRMRARTTINTLIRSCRALFGPKLRRTLPQDLHLPDPLPFSTIRPFKQGSLRYRSTVDPEKLLKDARAELEQEAPETYKAFVLCLLLGLRRSEADMLRWASVLWSKNAVRVERHSFFEPKCESSIGEVPADPELMSLLRQWHGRRTGDFIIESDVTPRLRTGPSEYRCTRHFDRLVDWLRSKGVTANSPIHILRKECGRLVTEKFGIFAASKMLRHASIDITSKFYADDTRHFGTGLGASLRPPVERSSDPDASAPACLPLSRSATKRRSGPKHAPSSHTANAFPRILAVSDLHADWQWYAWVIRHAHRFDMICLGGDLCEMTAERVALKAQHQSIVHRLGHLAAIGRPLAVAEGNHDDARRGWLGSGPGLEKVMWPGFSGEVCAAGRRLILSVCHDTVVDGVNAPGRIAATFQAGAAARDRTASPWLVLHHEPPEGTPICSGAHGNRLLSGLVAHHQPDLVVCGHIHEAPFERYSGGHWHCRIGQTLLVNAGQWPNRPWPCHLRIDGDIVIWRAPGHPRESARLTEQPPPHERSSRKSNIS